MSWHLSFLPALVTNNNKKYKIILVYICTNKNSKHTSYIVLLKETEGNNFKESAGRKQFVYSRTSNNKRSCGIYFFFLDKNDSQVLWTKAIETCTSTPCSHVQIILRILLYLVSFTSWTLSCSKTCFITKPKRKRKYERRLSALFYYQGTYYTLRRIEDL